MGLLTAALALLLLIPGAADATGIYDPGTLLFQTQDQSMWGTGDAIVKSYSSFLGTTWNADTGTIGGIAGQQHDPVPGTGGSVTVTVLNPVWIAWNACQPFSFIHSCGSEPAKHITKTVNNPIPQQFIDSREGATVDLKTTGKVGFDVGASFNSGSVNADLSYNATAKLPTSVEPGGFFNLNPQSSLAGVHDLSTIFPTVSGHVNAVVDASMSVSGEGCQAPLGCATGSGGFGFSSTIPLVSFNEPDSQGQIKVLGVADPSLFQFGSPISIHDGPFDYGDVTVDVPDIQTSTSTVDNGALSTTGVSNFLELRADILGIALAAEGIPTVTALSLDAGPVSVGYNLLTVEAGPNLNIVQNLTLTQQLMADLEFSKPVDVVGKGQVTSYQGAWNSLPDIQLLDDNPVTITPKFFVDAQLNNQTGFGIQGAFDVSALGAEVSVDALGLSFPLGQVGPLFTFNPTTGTLALPPLLNNTFGLGGFNSIAGTPIVLDQSGVHLQTVDTGDFSAELQTGTPAILSQLVDNPGDAFELAFDYQFVTGTGTLSVFLQDGDQSLDLADLTGSGPESAFEHFAQTYSFADLCANFIGVSCDPSTIFKLAFNFDDPGNEGSILKLDNISLADLSGESFLLNGDFQTGSLSNWQINDSQHVQLSEEATLVAAPEPATLLVFMPGIAGLMLMRRRRLKRADPTSC